MPTRGYTKAQNKLLCFLTDNVPDFDITCPVFIPYPYYQAARTLQARGEVIITRQQEPFNAAKYCTVEWTKEGYAKWRAANAGSLV
jgi:NAD-dependent DNA ligase